MSTARRRWSRLTVMTLVLALPAGGVLAKDPGPAEQLKFGVAMAKRGLWSEALFRFDQALKLAPADPKILNNLAVAYEAVGRFEDALETYQKAIKAAPANRELKRNYAQFLEFYQGFKPPEEEDAEAGAEVGEEPGGASSG